jgi:hypothetical protein
MDGTMDDQTIQKAPVDVGPENTKLINDHADAFLAGDRAEADRLRRLALFRPESLMALKIAGGADYIREKGYRTDLADRKYGHGWLDR